MDADEEEDAEGLLSAEELDDMHAELDKDKDGKLLESEVWDSILEEGAEDSEEAPEVMEKLKQVLKESDADKDGVITKPELASFVQGAQSILEDMDLDAEDDMDMEGLEDEDDTEQDA